MFEEIKKKLGFGCMRLPQIGDEIDVEQLKKMFDLFIEAGFNYFDTAKPYHGGKSELAVKECLTSRYPRNAYVLADKLTSGYIETKDDVRKVFGGQLEACGVDYFDFYLVHCVTSQNYNKYKNCDAFNTLNELKKEGKIKHLGMSFHDTADVLDQILSEQPMIDFVQLQFNYLDYESAFVQSRKNYDVCAKYNKPITVMEPVKGGKLANLPTNAANYLDDLNNGSQASYAIRFAASHENVLVVLSGMSNIEQVEDNISYMKDFQKINNIERNAIENVVREINKLGLIPCTSCRYCAAGCPKQIKIHSIFEAYNTTLQSEKWGGKEAYNRLDVKANECIKCGKCESSCPQHIQIRDLLAKIAKEFE